jgi:pyrroloquinoline quinone (PQQ) biosynthesis protein C
VASFDVEYLNDLRGRVRDEISEQKLVCDLFAGCLDRSYYARYLENVWHYAQHSAVVIGTAGARCVPTHPKLADYLLHHARQELGHEEWALSDLAAMGISTEQVRVSRPVLACAAMVGMEYYVAAHANPVGIFGWLYVLEAMGDDLGHAAAQSVRRGLDLPDGIKFLAGHGEADAEHTKDIIEQIKHNVPTRDLKYVYFVADVMAELYVLMFRQISDGK